MSKTQTLVKLLEKKACDPANPYAYVSGFLTSLIEEFEMEDCRVQDILTREIERVKNFKQGDL
jgi:hypothetical protein